MRELGEATRPALLVPADWFRTRPPPHPLSVSSGKAARMKNESHCNGDALRSCSLKFCRPGALLPCATSTQAPSACEIISFPLKGWAIRLVLHFTYPAHRWYGHSRLAQPLKSVHLLQAVRIGKVQITSVTTSNSTSRVEISIFFLYIRIFSPWNHRGDWSKSTDPYP